MEWFTRIFVGHGQFLVLITMYFFFQLHYPGIFGQGLKRKAGCGRWRCGTAVTAASYEPNSFNLGFCCPGIRSSNFLALEVFFLAESNFFFSFRDVPVSLLSLCIGTADNLMQLPFTNLCIYCRHKPELNSHILYKLWAATTAILLFGDSMLLPNSLQPGLRVHWSDRNKLEVSNPVDQTDSW